jgi:drug/metabolite transporter, DME family
MSRTQSTFGSSGFFLVALAASLWASDGLFRRGLALDLPASTLVLLEHFILVLLTLPIVIRALRVARTFSAREWAAILIVGAGASALATVLFTHTFTLGDPTTPLLLQKMQPLVAVAGARVLLGERMKPRFGAYLLAGVAGAYLISFSDPFSIRVAEAAAAAFALGAAALWGLGTVLGRYLTLRRSAEHVTALRFLVGFIAGAAIVAVQSTGDAVSTVDASGWVAVGLLALVPGLIALSVYYRGLSRTPAAAATIAELAFPVSAITINFIAFGETLTATQLLGTVVLSGTIVAMGLVGRHNSRRVGIEPRPAFASQSSQ